MANGDRPHFEIRDELVHDDLVTRTGFGETFQRPDFAEHGTLLVRRTQAFRAASAHALDVPVSDSVFMRVRTPPTKPIRQEKARLRSVGLDLVSYSRTDPSAATARIAKLDLDRLEGRMLDYATRPNHPGRSYLSIIEDVSEVPTREKIAADLIALPPEEQIDCILYVQSSLTALEQRAILEQIGNFVTRNEGELLDSHHFSSGIATALVRVQQSRLEALGHSFNTVREIRPNRVYFVGDSTPIAPLPNPLPVDAPRTQATVAVVDSGINPACNVLAGLVRGVSSELPQGSVGPHYEHGTFVASRVAFGDDLEAQMQRGRLISRCWVYDVQIFGRTPTGTLAPTDEHRLAAALDTMLPGLPPEARVVNLSLGTDHPIVDEDYSLVASTLDHLARQHNLLIVTTAGNVRHPNLLRAYPTSITDAGYRIDPPGESLLALTVGSIANHGDGTTMSAPRELSPFSRIGPGADGGRKPEVVSHGGNFIRPGVAHSRYAIQGIHGDGRRIAWDNGTSFAAPLVAAQGAELFQAYPNADANLIKALLCHYTLPAVAPGAAGDPMRCVGFGEPDSEAALGSVDSSASFLYRGRLNVQRYQFIPFLVPATLSEDNPRSRLRIRGTLIYNPPVDANNPQEYSRTRIALKLRKPAQVGYRDVALGNAMLSYYQWNPVIHFDKLFGRQYSPGNWEVRLRLYSRDLPEEFEQDYALIIEVRDELGGTDVWGDVRAEAGDDYLPMTVNVAA